MIILSKIVYNKLIRDKIPCIIEAAGKKAVTHVADEDEYLEKLHQKLKEEFDEYFEKEAIEELMDIQEVLEALVKTKGMSWDKFIEKKSKKQKDRGSFDKRIILESVEE